MDIGSCFFLLKFNIRYERLYGHSEKAVQDHGLLAKPKQQGVIPQLEIKPSRA